MKNVAKEHPLKPICLSYREGFQAAAFEVEALKKYKKAHDETWKRRITYVTEKDRLMLLKSELAELSYELFDLGEQLSVFEEALGITVLNEIDRIKIGSDYDVNRLFDRVEQHNRSLQRLHKAMKKAAARYNKAVANLYEDNYMIDPMYFDILHELFQRHEEVKVDIVSLDQDHQAFLEAYHEVKKLREAYMLYGNQVFSSYEQLLEDAEDLYMRTNAVQDGIDEMMDGDSA